MFPWRRPCSLGKECSLKLQPCWPVVAGPALQRDEQGVLRVFQLGFESHRVLREWLQNLYRKEALAATGRVRRSYHRRDPNLAVGLDLPAPLPQSRVLAAGHKAVWRASSSRPYQLASLASGGSCWYYYSLRRGALNEFTVCGLPSPSRPRFTLVLPCDRGSSCRDPSTCPSVRGALLCSCSSL